MAYYPQAYPALQNWYGQFYQPVQPPLQNPMPQMLNQQPQQATQSPAATQAPVQGTFVRVQSEQEARAYPVAPGNSITFIDESRPYCYTKSVEMSQLDRPKFDRYRLVKEEDPDPSDTPVRPENGPQGPVPGGGYKDPEYALKSDLDRLSGVVEALKAKIEKEVKKEGKNDGEPAD